MAMPDPTIAAFALAVYGAGLSTYNLIASRRDARRRLKAKLSINVLADTLEPRTVFMLSAANPGQRVVKLNWAAIRFPDGTQFVPLEPNLGRFLPCELQEGKTLEIPIGIELVVQALHESGF